ncbi:MAG: hypothetical protein CL923_11885 [Deltaproteobacteria bacterium]|jgi:hypothetical protein|nr:hypothetical protein [Deltaproteobacteria bacterium]MBQ33229.1 hypothetical protein [Deltaproteobacteria bacterium]|tara:strand:+ start:6416 stop:7507 length:1092 start_codon:yes stop_codon:yes gene_type:complete
MLKRILICASIAFCIGFAVYLFKLQDDRGSMVKGEGGECGLEGTPVAELKWNREIEEVPGKESLASLREKLLARPSSEAVAEIEGFLRKGKDRKTDLNLKIGKGGKIEGWPTLRVFLLDLLLEIDPGSAARISREILRSETSADEWAIALRNVAKGERLEGNRDYLRTRTEDLITNPEWQAQPSVGYLNAFDVLVYTGATESLPLLSGLIQRKDRHDLAHASFLTMDRLVQRQPIDMLTRLKADRALQQSRPEMTAQQFARADLRDTSQQAIVKSWLLDPSRTSTELQNFAAIYPNNNKLISHNMLTSQERVSGTDLNAHDREVLEVIRDWRTDPAFESRSQYLEVMDRRVSQFVESADGSSR